MSHSTSSNEQQLVLRLKEDNMQAFDELYWKYQKAVFQNVFKLTRDALIAEDIVQEVFITLWEKRHSLDDDRSVGGWLFVSSYNRAVNALKKKLRESLAIKKIAASDEEDATDPEPDFTDVQLAILEKAIIQLSPQKRKVFELCKLQGKSYEEAAKALGISRHTVKEYLSASVQFIKDFVAKHPGTGAGLLLIMLN